MAEKMFLDAVAAASAAFDEKDYRKAIVAVEKARDNFQIDYDCNEDVQSAASRLGEIMCESLSMIGKFEEAIQEGLSIARRYPNRFEIPLSLARVYQKTRQYEEARLWCGKAYTLNPKSTTVRITMKAIETDIKIEQSNQSGAARMASSPIPSSASGIFETSTNSTRPSSTVPAMATLPSPRAPLTPIGLAYNINAQNGATLSTVSSASFQRGSPTSLVSPIPRSAPLSFETKSTLRPPNTIINPPTTEIKPVDSNHYPPYQKLLKTISLKAGFKAAAATGTLLVGILFISIVHSYFGSNGPTIMAIPLEVFTSSLLTCVTLAAFQQGRSAYYLQKKYVLNNNESILAAAQTASAVDEAPTTQTAASGTGSVTLRAPRTLQRRSVVH